MAEGGQLAESLARRYAVLRPHLDERQRRLLLGIEAQQLGLNRQVSAYLSAGQPVVSVDLRRRESAGQISTGGVPVDADHDTSAFAVHTLRRWWDTLGRRCYPAAHRLLICADVGGIGSRVRAWTIDLAKLAADTGLDVMVCHRPSDTSKWNDVDHRLISQLTMNWPGQPLTTHQIIVDSINGTGMTTGRHPAGSPYPKRDLDALPITRHDFHGEWNYTIRYPSTP